MFYERKGSRKIVIKYIADLAYLELYCILYVTNMPLYVLNLMRNSLHHHHYDSASRLTFSHTTMYLYHHIECCIS